LATYTVPSGGVSSITFAGLPTGGQYSHLQLRVTLATWATGGNSDYMRINGDSGSNYTWHYLVGSGSSASAGSSTGQTGVPSFFSTPTVSPRIYDILDYANTNKYKTIRSLVGGDANGSGYIWFQSSLWLNTAAITSLTFNIDSNNIPQYSQFSLYGVKG
jgi:hypothetical protein